MAASTAACQSCLAASSRVGPSRSLDGQEDKIHLKTESQQLRRQMAGIDEVIVGATDENQFDKILWAEKFLDIAGNLNEKLWLTDVFPEYEDGVW